MEKIHMTTLSTVLEKLRVKRQDNEFTMTQEGFSCNSSKIYQPEDLTIIKTYRFEGESDPFGFCNIVFNTGQRWIGGLQY